MPTYLIKTTVQSGGVVKTTTRMITAPTSVRASEYAIECEAHSELEWADGSAYDMGGEWCYSPRSVRVLIREQVTVLTDVDIPHHKAI